MSDRNEREERAFDALIVSHLLRERDLADPNDLPDLTESERKAMSDLSMDLVDHLWDAEEKQLAIESAEYQPYDTCVDEEEFAAMNRGEEMDEDTKKKLDLARKEILDAMRNQKKGDSDANR